MDWIRAELSVIEQAGLLRKRRLRENLKDFCSNDYLGLRNHPEVIKAAREALKEYGLGSGASQLVSGYTKLHKELEEALARFKGTPACVLFGSGYLANIGVIPVLAKEGDLILSDQLNHASLIDGCRLSKAEKIVFKHKDYEELRGILEKFRENYRNVLIVTDSVFSMEGDTADVKELYKISEEYDCLLYIDDAHGTGTLGRGRGILEKENLKWKERVILMGTLSKALGSYGAFVCAGEELIELIVNRARSLIFTTSLPPSLCAGALKAIKLIEENPNMISQLKERTRKVYNSLNKLPYEIRYYGTPIIPIIVGDERKTMEISSFLLKKSIFLQGIRYPAVPKGSARLRLTVSLRYEEEDIEELLNILNKV